MKVTLPLFCKFIASALLLGTLSSTSATVNAQTSNQVNKAREAEAKNIIGSMTRAQQAYYLENNKFSRTIQELGVGIRPETENYRYRIVPQGNQTQKVMTTAQAKRAGLRSYTSAVFVVKMRDELVTVATLCETDKPSSTPPTMPVAPRSGSTDIQCPAGSHRLGR
jgi:type II secretory pathway pseudopilin PulG